MSIRKDAKVNINIEKLKILRQILQNYFLVNTGHLDVDNNVAKQIFKNNDINFLIAPDGTNIRDIDYVRVGGEVEESSIKRNVRFR